MNVTEDLRLNEKKLTKTFWKIESNQMEQRHGEIEEKLKLNGDS